MRVLYINQTAQMSGGEHSLVTLLAALPADIEPLVACPDGDLADAVRALGVEHRRVTGTDVSFRLHPTRTAKGLAEIARAAAAVDRVARRERPDVLHANTARAGLISQVAARRGRAPLVVSIREPLAEGRVAALTRRVLAGGAAALVPNSQFMRGQLADIESRVTITTVHNAVDLRHFDADAHDRGAARTALGVGDGVALLGVVGQITTWKGHADAIDALAVLRRTVPDAELLIAGSAKFAAAGTRYDNVGYERGLHEQAARLGLGGAVRFAGERSDVPAVMAALDLLLVPSWWEAFGRVALEAMAMGVPVLATSNGGTAEIVRDGIDGLLLEPRRPQLWADAAASLLVDRERRLAFAASGRERARSAFSPEHHAAQVRAVYADVTATSAARSAGGR